MEPEFKVLPEPDLDAFFHICPHCGWNSYHNIRVESFECIRCNRYVKPRGGFLDTYNILAQQKFVVSC